MYQTIHRQPQDLRRILSTGWEPAQRAADQIARAGRVFVVGLGTSYHAALVGAWLLRAAGADARAILSFDFALYPATLEMRPDDAVVVMAHTGTKRYSGESMARSRAAGVIVISVGSLTAEHPDSQLVLRTVEREKSAAFTASHLGAMTVLAQVATALGERKNAAHVGSFRAALERLPEQVEEVLARQDEVAPAAHEAVARRIYAAGAGPNEATALESVIKVREAAFGNIDALALEQFLHGPMVAVNAGDLVVLVNVPGAAAQRVEEAAVVFDALGARLWLVGDGVAVTPTAMVFRLPEIPELLSPLLAVVPMQLLAYQMAVLKGVHPDLFRRDDPRYAAAFGKIKL